MSETTGSPKKGARDKLIGQVLAGRYEIRSRLGKGGMAVVYLADDRSFGREVAIKVLRTDVAKDPIAAKRLVREARAAGQLHHPHIITMHDVGSEEGMVYIVMEVLRGRELSELMEELGPIPVQRSLEIARQVASGLATAHRAGIVHRDIKPENLFLIDTDSGGDFVKMLDFSIAKLPTNMVTAALTRAGSVFGTPHYMAPEQVEGRTVSPLTDVYALGAVLYECLAGEPPFDGDSVIDILLLHARAVPPRLKDLGIWLPDGLDELVDSMLAKKIEDRPASAEDVERALEGMVSEARRATQNAAATEVVSHVTDAQVAEHLSRRASAGAPPPMPTPAASPRRPSEPSTPPDLPDRSSAPERRPSPPSPRTSQPSPRTSQPQPRAGQPQPRREPSAPSSATPSDLPGATATPADLPGAEGLGSSTILGVGLADQVRAEVARREAEKLAAASAIAPPPQTPAAIPAVRVSPSAPSSVGGGPGPSSVPPPPSSRARMESRLRRDHSGASASIDVANIDSHDDEGPPTVTDEAISTRHDLHIDDVSAHSAKRSASRETIAVADVSAAELGDALNPSGKSNLGLWVAVGIGLLGVAAAGAAAWILLN